jgi:hypothetical protein
MVTKMDKFDMQNISAGRPVATLESLCQEFDGSSFYGLEYIIEDFFPVKKSESVNLSSIDWFGLYD